MARRERHKKESTAARIKNWSISIILAIIMFCGLQSYSASSLRFVQVSDVHFSTRQTNTTYKLTGESPELLDDAIEQINAIPDVNFVMFTGDQIDKSFEKELSAFLPHAEKLVYPWYIAFGNHDTCIGGYLTPSVYLSLVSEHNKNFNFTTPYYSFVPQKGYKVIVLDTIIRDRITANGEISKEQLQWLDNQINASPKDTILIFMHVPIIEPYSSPGHKLLNAEEVEAVLEKYKNPIGVFQGHYHGAKITQKGNILYVSSAALVSYPNVFRVVNVTNYRRRVVFDIKTRETRLQNLQKLAKIMVFGTTIYSGEEQDQNGIYIIKK